MAAPVDGSVSITLASALNITGNGFDYRRMHDLLFSADYQPAPEQFFQLEEVDIEGASGTRFQSNENFTGILLLFFNVDASISSFDAMNKALKERAEEIARQP